MPHHDVTRAERISRHRHNGLVVWLTGLSGSGKSTLARRLERLLFDQGLLVVVLDGDIVRNGLSANLGFSPTDRSEQVRRVAEVARLFGDSGFIVIVALISPFAEDRARARQIVGRGDRLDFVEVYLDAGVEVCEQRDAKGLYRKARLGQIADFTGVSATYEAPTHPDLLLGTGSQTVEESLRLLHERVSRLALGNA